MAEVHKAQDAVKANPDARPKQPVADGNNSATPDGFIKWRVVDGQMTQVLALGMHAGAQGGILHPKPCLATGCVMCFRVLL